MTTNCDNISEDFELLLDKDATVKTDSIVKVQGKSFRCECGCNVFRKLIFRLAYKCNACEAIYEAE